MYFTNSDCKHRKIDSEAWSCNPVNIASNYGQQLTFPSRSVATILQPLPTSEITFSLHYCYLPSSRRPRESNCTVLYKERLTTIKYSNELFEGRNFGVPHWALRAAVWVRLSHPIRSGGVGIPFAWKQTAAQGWRECTQLLQKSRLHAGAEIDTSDPVTGRSSNSQCRTGWLSFASCY